MIQNLEVKPFCIEYEMWIKGAYYLTRQIKTFYSMTNNLNEALIYFKKHIQPENDDNYGYKILTTK